MLAILVTLVVAAVGAAALLTVGFLGGRAYEQRRALQTAGPGAGLPSRREIWLTTSVVTAVTVVPIFAVVIFVAVARHT